MAGLKDFKININSLYGRPTIPELAIGANVEPKYTNAEPEEWIWVEGYKGTDRDMKCRGYQFEMNKVHEMEEGANVKLCEGGFHLCEKLKDVFYYYGIGNGNRFFRVRALVRKSDVEKKSPNVQYNVYSLVFSNPDKLTSKSIQFLYELTPDEIFKAASYNVDGWSSEDKKLIIEQDYSKAKEMRNRTALIGCGYSEAFVEYIISKSETEVALQVGSQKDLSMDMKVLLIAHEILN
jgi:hypothetical protein